MVRLPQFAVEHNIRAVLLDLTECHTVSASQVVPALIKCGFKVGILSNPQRPLPRAKTTPIFVSTQPQSFLQDATQHLRVAANRSMVVQSLPTGSFSLRVGLSDVLLPEQLSIEAFVQDLLGFSPAFDPNWTHFGPHAVSKAQIFYESSLSMALVNLKPIVPGHVLVIPKRRMDRFLRLDADEVADLWVTAQHVASRLQGHYTAEAFTFSIQDGKAAGQTVPHCHIHVLPRHQGDFKRNDDIYDHLDKNDLSQKEQMNLDAERVARTLEEMAAEATILRALCA
ncbi:unnamed protein product [Aphanomyces euteiches]|uniref:HIT domain-containing protein n=1 Tax=Aphanomyces euteiches TaxID=100861 RepID=A0A6G0WPY5_9STRA|nr:hypothetical protein Ae201684_012925 [Aphanomyces euteiches]KAH9097659.1 hypothetical protein Ae201684P_001135 [Aphanomyces euteiches]